MFPFLQGRLRTYHGFTSFHAKNEFPFLQGRLRTLVYRAFSFCSNSFHSFKVGFVRGVGGYTPPTPLCFHSFKVGFVPSIPAVQLEPVPGFHSFKVGFVHLSEALDAAVACKFPFLQGRLRTPRELEEKVRRNPFPFLQGRLRTTIPTPVTCVPVHVSIPSR